MGTRQITEEERDKVKPYTRRQKVNHWGRMQFVTPVLVSTVIGDGQKLLAFQPLNTRPRYYLILVDSSCDESNIDTVLAEEDRGIDPIYEAIEDDFGNCHSEQNDKENSRCRRCRKSREEFPCSQCERFGACIYTQWPHLNEDCGASWWLEADLRKAV